uniref:Uncharacterized protein n=1 Tax=Ciona savignyi TaxID=51511 RepID=H2ZK88_CIOSA
MKLLVCLVGLFVVTELQIVETCSNLGLTGQAGYTSPFYSSP